MSFVDKYNSKYFKKGDIIEVIIKNTLDERIGHFKWNIADKKLEKKIFRILKEKYNIFSTQENNDDDMEWIHHT